MTKFDDSIINNINEKDRNQLITDYQPFILKVISELKGGYVDGSNDEFSEGLIAFNEAIDKYQPEKGGFLSFARLVIESRVKNYWKKEYSKYHLDIEDHLEYAKLNVDQDIKIELMVFEEKLKKFSISFDDLVDATPKHQKTKAKTISIGKKASKDSEIVEKMYQTFRLPITLISTKLNESRKVVKTHKKFITSVIVMFKEELEKIVTFIS